MIQGSFHENLSHLLSQYSHRMNSTAVQKARILMQKPGRDAIEALREIQQCFTQEMRRDPIQAQYIRKIDALVRQEVIRVSDISSRILTDIDVDTPTRKRSMTVEPEEFTAPCHRQRIVEYQEERTVAEALCSHFPGVDISSQEKIDAGFIVQDKEYVKYAHFLRASGMKECDIAEKIEKTRAAVSEKIEREKPQAQEALSQIQGLTTIQYRDWKESGEAICANPNLFQKYAQNSSMQKLVKNGLPLKNTLEILRLQADEHEYYEKAKSTTTDKDFLRNLSDEYEGILRKMNRFFLEIEKTDVQQIKYSFLYLKKTLSLHLSHPRENNLAKLITDKISAVFNKSYYLMRGGVENDISPWGRGQFLEKTVNRLHSLLKIDEMIDWGKTSSPEGSRLAQWQDVYRMSSIKRNTPEWNFVKKTMQYWNTQQSNQRYETHLCSQYYDIQKPPINKAKALFQKLDHLGLKGENEKGQIVAFASSYTSLYYSDPFEFIGTFSPEAISELHRFLSHYSWDKCHQYLSFIQNGGTLNLCKDLGLDRGLTSNKIYQPINPFFSAQDIKEMKSLTKEKRDSFKGIYNWFKYCKNYAQILDICSHTKKTEIFKTFNYNVSFRSDGSEFFYAVMNVCDEIPLKQGLVSRRLVDDLSRIFSTEKKILLYYGLSKEELCKSLTKWDFTDIVPLGKFKEIAQDLPLSIFTYKTLSDLFASKPSHEIKKWLSEKLEKDGKSIIRGHTFDTKHLDFTTYEYFFPFGQELGYNTILPPLHYYAAERNHRFEAYIQTEPLSKVPNEPLIRFLTSKPFSDISRWLNEEIDNPEGQQRRVDSLSLEQKKTILQRFKRYDSALPLQQWLDMLGVSEDEAREFCALNPLPLTREEEVYHNKLQKKIDPQDPTSLFLSTSKSPRTLPLVYTPQTILTLLESAQETSICGERVVLTWGNASEETLCSAQDSLPLYAHVDGKPYPMYQKGLFNDFSFSVPAVTLHRKLKEHPDLTAKINVAFSAQTPPTEWPEEAFEIKRISDHLNTCSTEITAPMAIDEEAHIESVIPETEIPDENIMEVDSSEVLSDTASEIQKVVQYLAKNPRQSRTFLPLLRKTVQALSSPSIIENPPKEDSLSYRNAATFIALLVLARFAHIQPYDERTDITLSSDVQFHLKSLDPNRYEEHREDNPGLTPTQFYEFISDYPLHTLSPITPNRSLSPQKFCSFVSSIKKLSENTFYSTCASCLQLLTADDMSTEGYFDLWNQSLPANKKLSENIRDVACGITKKYLPLVIETTTVPISPNKTYLYNPRGIDDFCDEEDVPYFIREEGNFASMLCRFFEPCKPDLHDGNCAINSFLIGLKGREGYSGQYDPRLQTDVRTFRQQVVKYAQDHLQDLHVEFGDKEVNDLIAHYASSKEWTNTLAWKCAATCFGRPIYIYSRGTGQTFTLNDKAQLKPLATLHPEGEPTGPPIHVMQWGVHYCTLFPK